MTSALTSRPARLAAIAGSTLVAGALVVGAAGTATAAPVTGSAAAVAAPAPAAAAPALTAKKSKLTDSQLQSIAANAKTATKAPASAAGISPGFKAKAFTYSPRDMRTARYLLLSAAVTGTSYQAMKKEMSTTSGDTKIVSTKFNDKKKTGAVQVAASESMSVDMPDGSKRDVMVHMIGKVHLHDKIAVMTMSVYIPDFGGTKAATVKANDKAAVILAKNYGFTAA